MGTAGVGDDAGVVEVAGVGSGEGVGDGSGVKNGVSVEDGVGDAGVGDGVGVGDDVGAGDGVGVRGGVGDAGVEDGVGVVEGVGIGDGVGVEGGVGVDDGKITMISVVGNRSESCDGLTRGSPGAGRGSALPEVRLCNRHGQWRWGTTQGVVRRLPSQNFSLHSRSNRR